MIKPIDPLQIVLERLGYADPVKGAFFLWDEVNNWPSGALDTLMSSGVLQPAQPVNTVECDGCEEKCVMPMTIYLAGEDKEGRAFITCDKREDIGRIKVSFDRMRQWHCSIDAVRAFVAASLGLRLSDKRLASGTDLWEIGVAMGYKRSQMLCLQIKGELTLIAGNNKIPLAELIAYHNGSYSLDDKMIRQLVDTSTTADIRYTPSNTKREARKLDTARRYQSWQKEYRRLKKNHSNKSDTWYSVQIAKLDIAKGRDSETIRKHMKS